MIFSFLCPGFIGMSSIMSYSGGRAAVETVVGEGDKTEDSRRVWGGCLGQPEIHARPSCRRGYVWTIVITTSLVVNGRFHARSCARSCAQCHGEKARRHTMHSPYFYIGTHRRTHPPCRRGPWTIASGRHQCPCPALRGTPPGPPAPASPAPTQHLQRLPFSQARIFKLDLESLITFVCFTVVGGNSSIPRVCVIAMVCFYFVYSYNRR